LARSQPGDDTQEDAEPQDYIRDFALRRESRKLRREIDAVALLVEVITVGRRDAIDNRPSEAGEFLDLKGALVDPGNLRAAFELEHVTIVALAGIKLDDDLIVFGLPAGVKVGILLKDFGCHRQLNDHRL